MIAPGLFSDKDPSKMNNDSDKRNPPEEHTRIDFFTVMGHDLKSPLNAVESYLDIMQGKILGEDIDAYMPIIGNCFARLNQMRELITDVVDFSRLDSPETPRSLISVDLSKIAHAVLNSFSAQAQERNISISTEIEDAVIIEAEAKEIELIIRHLAGNAIKYNTEGGSVRVTVRRSGPSIELIVSDTGIGISEQDRQRLFQAFVRIKNKDTQDIRGTGLGLAIVKRLVDLYKGSISVASKPGIETVFSVVLPAL